LLRGRAERRSGGARDAHARAADAGREVRDAALHLARRRRGRDTRGPHRAVSLHRRLAGGGGLVELALSRRAHALHAARAAVAAARARRGRRPAARPRRAVAGRPARRSSAQGANRRDIERARSGASRSAGAPRHRRRERANRRRRLGDLDRSTQIAPPPSPRRGAQAAPRVARPATQKTTYPRRFPKSSGRGDGSYERRPS